ncbi:short-chain dehydrogenase/reductase [Mollisia scopiformis]|uniref:Short-chain dehydrogenase/reductase n=1 Tax=Mollisia scopiformis TaxID=149040 RepID=A0A132B675_MOLSC|nr:short-chain dehydrogenase/reductase [Mollisia scopiformis]KUJ07499.1 short-chain dehydrogenase/reductase [Mollisia scopiformis]
MASARKSVLITGCSAGGTGAALAEVFHEKGYHVFATARTPSKVSQSLSKSANVTVLTLDVLSSDSIAAAVKSVSAETGGKLDVLVNNSGTGIVLPALDTSIEDGKKLFDVNFWAVFAMIQAFAPLLKSAGGYVVNMASVSGVVPIVFNSFYNASKGALVVASETWRLELGPLGIKTLTLMTAAVKTNFFQNIDAVKVPENSYYSSVRDFIEGLGDGKAQENGISAREFATKVVREVEKGTTGKFWVGGGAAGARWGSWLLPQWALDRLLESMNPVSGRIANDHKTRKA